MTVGVYPDQRSVVVDIDGVLADCAHRMHLIQGPRKNYAAFYSASAADKPNAWCQCLVNAMRANGFPVHFVSARPERLRAITTQWLQTHIGSPYELHLLRRDDADGRPDTDLKTAWAQAHGVERILFWVEDRQRVVDALRKMGVVVLGCAGWTEARQQRQLEKAGGTR